MGQQVMRCVELAKKSLREVFLLALPIRDFNADTYDCTQHMPNHRLSSW